MSMYCAPILLLTFLSVGFAVVLSLGDQSFEVDEYERTNFSWRAGSNVCVRCPVPLNAALAANSQHRFSKKTLPILRSQWKMPTMGMITNFSNTWYLRVAMIFFVNLLLLRITITSGSKRHQPIAKEIAKL